ncbi:MAG TPA: LCP family protein [Candidatus Stackebrandtia excrementipullorum]|nr:LCP family protein [Candidatus Stackebrandtia excrementipullorum]
MVGLGALLMVMSLGTVVYARTLLNAVEDSIENRDLLGDGEMDDGDIEGPLNLLVLGNDHRENNKDGDKVGRTDTILIMHINKNLDSAALLSFPRDLLVDVPNCGPNYNWQSCQTKLNDAYPSTAEPSGRIEDGVQNLAASLTNLTGLPRFNGAAMVKFDGFADLVDVFGSVELCLPFDMEVVHSKNEDLPLGPNGRRLYPKGCNEYSKNDALGIVRERYAYGPETPGWTEEWGISDFGRQRMQQHFIKQLLKRAQQEGYMSDPTKVGPLIEEIGKNIMLDIGGRTVTNYAVALRNVDIGSMLTLKVPSEPADINGTSYVVTQPGEQEAAAAELYEALQNDTIDQWAAKYPQWVNTGD